MTFYYIRMVFKSIFFLAVFGTGILHLSGQDKINYELIAGYSTQGDGIYQYIVRPGTPIIFDWSINIQDYINFTNKMDGKLLVVISADTLIDEKDKALIEKSGQVTNFVFQRETINQTILPGEYYLLAKYYSNDTVKYDDQSNTLILTVKIYNIDYELMTGYSTQGGGSYQYIIKPETPIIFDWSVNIKDYENFNKNIAGKLIVVLSADTLVDEDDNILIKKSRQVTSFDFKKETLSQSVPPGEYF